MSLKETEQQLEKDNKFIFIGEESYLAKRFLDHLKAQLNPDFVMFNYIEVDQRKEGFEELLMKIEAVPMMDQKKLIHISNFNYALESNSWSKDQIKEFQKVLEFLAPDTKLVISNDEVQKAGNLGLYKSLSKIVSVIQLDRLNPAELRSFLEKSLREKLGKHEIAKPILAEVINISGYTEKNSKTDLYHIEEMATKLSAFYREKGSVLESDLYELFQVKKEADIFRLLNAIRDVDKPAAFREYLLLREAGEHNIKIMISLAKMLSSMVKSSYYLEEGYNSKDIARELGRNPYAVESGLVFVRKFGRKKLIEMIEAIIEIDYKLKTGNIDDNVYGELALIHIFEIIER